MMSCWNVILHIGIGLQQKGGFKDAIIEAEALVIQWKIPYPIL